MNFLRTATLAALVCLNPLAPTTAWADQGLQGSTTPPPMPVALPAEQFQEVLVSVGDDLFNAGQPTEQGLRDLAAAGVSTVVNLRTHREMDDRQVVPFDEAALVAELGLTYVHIPSGGTENPYSPEMVERFAEALTESKGKVLLHCTVAWRASHLYTAWLYRHGGLSLAQAVNQGQAVNLGHLPLEGFLGERLAIDVVTSP